MRALWQACIVLFALIGLANMTGDLFDIHDGGTFGFDQPPAIHSNSFVVHAVTPHSPAAAADVRAGDTLTRAPGLKNRIIMFATVPGDTATFNDEARSVTLTAVRDESAVPWALIAIIDIAKLAFITIALVIVWRRPDDSAARALAVFLVCFGVAINFDLVLVSSYRCALLRLDVGAIVISHGCARRAHLCLPLSGATDGRIAPCRIARDCAARRRRVRSYGTFISNDIRSGK